MENKLYIGIDVGAKGFVSTQYNSSWEHYSIAGLDLYELSRLFQELRQRYDSIACVIEDVHAVHGSSAKATFQFGFNKGYLIGLLAANQIPYTLVAPKQWQKEMWGYADIVATYKHVTIKDKDTVRKEVNTKQTSINCCKRLFPTLDLRKSERSKNIDDNKVDSILLCDYGRRMNL